MAMSLWSLLRTPIGAVSSTSWAIPDWASGDEWNSFPYRIGHLFEIGDKMDEWAKTQKKEDFHHQGSARGFSVGTMYNAEEVLNYRQYLARDYFVDVDHPQAGNFRYAGWPYKMTASPPQVSRPAPLLGQHNDEVLREITRLLGGRMRGAAPVGRDLEGRDAVSEQRLPLEGVRVVDMSWVWAGPYCSMLLAALGAEVIKIESRDRLDFFRRYVIWPLADAAPTELGVEESMMFQVANMSKLSVTLNLARPEGMDLLKRLIAVSDVVVENMRPGAMERMGLATRRLTRIRPGIIMLSSSARGGEGPECLYAGYAAVNHAVGGGAYITGYADGPPAHAVGDVDIMNATASAFAIVAALRHRRQTGEGQFIDFSQCEGVTSFLGEVLLDYQMTGRIPGRKGNSDELMAPHNVYPCWGIDRWLAIAVETDAEFAALCEVMEMPELASTPASPMQPRASAMKPSSTRSSLPGRGVRTATTRRTAWAPPASQPRPPATARTSSTIRTCASEAPSSRWSAPTASGSTSWWGCPGRCRAASRG